MTAESTPQTLRQLIQEYFDLEDLRALCFDLGVDYDELGEGIGKSARVVKLIQHTKQHGRLGELLDYLQHQRPHVDWLHQLTETNLGLEPGRLVNVPPLPPHFLSREPELSALRRKMLADLAASVVITGQSKAVGVQGMGGIGKSVLAAVLARDETVRDAFSDGIYWLELGQTPNLLLRQSQLAEALGDGPRAFEDTQQGKARLSQLLADKTCLIILDDVWQKDQAQALDVVSDSRSSRLLLTTRDSSLLTGLGAIEHRLDVLDESQALVLLADWTGQEASKLPAVARQVAKHCDYLPLAISLCGAQVRDGLAWEDVLAALAEADLTFLDHPHGSVMASMHLSLAALPEKQRELYQLLGAVPEDMAIPETALVGVWGQVGQLGQHQSRHLLTQLAGKSLLRLSGEMGNRFVSLHDLQHLYLRQQVGAMSRLHQQWLAAYAAQCSNGWASGPNDGYFFQHLAYHLHVAERVDELRQLLLTFIWLKAKLDAVDVNSLIEDYTWAGVTNRDDSLWLVQRALRLSAHVLAEDKNQLAGHLLGRLLALVDDSEGIGNLLAEIRARQEKPWLCPLRSSLTPPSSPLLRTLVGHTGSVNIVVITPNGRYAVSTAGDTSLKVWDMEQGQVRHTLKGHSSKVRAIVVTADSRYAISASSDHTLKVWDLELGKLRHTFKGHSAIVNAVAVTPDGRYAISASSDHTLKVWDLKQGQVHHTLIGHSRKVTAVAIVPNGRYVVSASRDRTLKVWNLEQGQARYTFAGHTDEVNIVTVTPDGRYAISASSDHTLKVWDLELGKLRHTFKGHSAIVNAVAVTPDGRYAISASSDHTLKVWDLKQEEVCHTLIGHTGSIIGVAVTPDGRHAVSASSDYTLKVWNLEQEQVPYAFIGHTEAVIGVAVTPDGRHAISASRDRTLKIWDLKQRRARYTLKGHSAAVNAVAVTPDGRHAISASRDRTLKVWDLGQGELRHTFKGHSAIVNAVAVTPDGRYAISASSDHTLKVWDLKQGQARYTFAGHTDEVNIVTVTPDGRYAVSASIDHTLKVWDLEQGEVCHTLTGHTGGVRAVAVIPESHYIISASRDRTLKVWDLKQGQVHHTLIGHTGSIIEVAVTPDGRYAISASRDRTLKVWDLKQGRVRYTLKGHAGRVIAVGVTQDGRHAASAAFDTLKVWDLEQGQVRYTLKGHSGGVRAMVVTPNNHHVFSASHDHFLKVWDLECGELVASFRTEASLTCLGVTIDGVTVIAGDESGQIHIFRLEMPGERNLTS